METKMTKITKTMIDCILIALCLTTLTALFWLLMENVAEHAERSQVQHCTTEDQPGWCEWNGQVRYNPNR